MAKQNGTLYAVFVGATDRILYLTECSLGVDVNMFDTTTKESAGWEEHGNGLRKWSVPFSGKVDTAQIGGVGLLPEDILDNIIARTADANISWTPDSMTSGYEGLATFSNCNISAPMEDAVTFSGTLTGNGPLAKIT